MSSGSRFPALTAGALLLMVVTVFFPTLLGTRVMSPLDTLSNASPWRAQQHTIEATDPALRPVASRVLPELLELRREGFATAVWDPTRAGGGPGTLSWDRGLLWPFTLPLVPLVPETHLVNALVLARLVVAFVGLWLLVRRLGVGEVGAAAGGAVYALAGPLVARWSLPSSAAMATLPLLLWAVDRAKSSPESGRRLAGLTLTWLAFLAAGDPAITVLGGLLAVAWAVLPSRTSDPRRWLVQLAAPLLATAILAPAMALSATRTDPPRDRPVMGWGVEVARLLADPMAWGSPRAETYQPPDDLGNVPFADACLTPGLIALALAALGIAARRPAGPLWAAGAAASLAALAAAPVGRLLVRLPGIDSVSLPEVAGVAALAFAVLAAFGAEELVRLAPSSAVRAALSLLVVAVVLEQGLLAGHLSAYLPTAEARLAATPGLELVMASQDPLEPTRVAPLLDMLPPDTASAFGLEDLRSAGPTRPDYERWLQIIDPQAVGDEGLRLNAATADLTHPYLAFLGVRMLIEPPAPRLVEYTLAQQATEVEPRDRQLGPLDGRPVEQVLRLPEGCARVALYATARGAPVSGELEVALRSEPEGRALGRWQLDAAALDRDGLAWLDIPDVAATSARQRLVVSGRPEGQLWLRTTSDPSVLGGKLTWGGIHVDASLAPSFDTSGWSVVYDGTDLRLWVDRRAGRRFSLVRRVLPGDLSTVVGARPPLDLATTVVLAPEIASELSADLDGRSPSPDEHIRVERASPGGAELEVFLDAPAVLVAAIPSSPLWRASVDGRPRPLLIANGLFLALPLEAGSHRVELAAGIATVWYVGCGAGIVGLLAAAFAARRRPRSARGGTGQA